MSSSSVTILTIPSDAALTLSMIRPTSICIVTGGEGCSAVVPIGIVLPDCAMISQGMTAIINDRGMEEIWLLRDYRRVRISTYFIARL